MDATKVFDVVWHSSMLFKLFNYGVKDTTWLLLHDWYKNLTSKVKWIGEYSNSFTETQGVRQGGIWSPMMYKLFINPLLCDLEKSGYGLRIGNYCCGTPTCADDLLLLSDSPSDLTTMMKSVQDYASKEHYEISTTKTKNYGV